MSASREDEQSCSLSTVPQEKGMECRDEHPYWQGIALAGEEKQEEMRSMTRRPPARRRPAVDAAPRSDVVQSNTSARTSGGFTTLLESATQPILAVSYWFDPATHLGPYPVTVRFSGRRVAHAGVRSPYTRAKGARERDPCDWSAASSRSVVAPVGAIRRVGRTGENLPDPLRPCAGDHSRYLGSDGDAGHRCRAGAPVPGDFR